MSATAHANAPAAAPARARFLGESREYWRILSRDGVLLILTLGLYRFWVANDIRRYLWSNTEIAGDELEYTGDPFELLVGFLVLVVILCPLFAAASLAILISGQVIVALVFPYVALVCLVPIALLTLYQARRYRLGHTLFRGVRFRQRGSAWIYALLTACWSVVNILTLGLTYPLSRRSRERYKMRHAFYGDLQGDFRGAAFRLFKTGFLLWLLVLGPAIAIWFSGLSGHPTDEEAAKAMGRGALWIVVVGLLVYPAFHATVLRWRIDGMRFGAMTFEAPFSTWGLYKAYLRFFGLMVLLVIAILAAAAFWQFKIQPLVPDPPAVLLALLGVVALALAYFLILTIIAFAYQATVRLTLWRLIVNSLSVTGLETLDNVKAMPGWTPHREGRIAGALNIGGF